MKPAFLTSFAVIGIPISIIATVAAVAMFATPAVADGPTELVPDEWSGDFWCAPREKDTPWVYHGMPFNSDDYQEYVFTPPDNGLYALYISTPCDVEDYVKSIPGWSPSWWEIVLSEPEHNCQHPRPYKNYNQCMTKTGNSPITQFTGKRYFVVWGNPDNYSLIVKKLKRR